MARTKAKGTAASTPTSSAPLSSAASARRRPFNALFISVFLAIAAVTTWLMRVETQLSGVPVGFMSVVEAGRFADGTPLEARYTGIGVVDGLAQFLVTAFLSGTARWDVGVHLQQSYFLVGNWFPVVCVWMVEACRRRNAGRLISRVTLIGLFYQVASVCTTAPLYCVLCVYASAGDAYYRQGRQVPLSYAKALLPATLLGYLVPTAALYYVPWGDVKTVQYMTALWQPFPLFVGAALLIFSFVVPVSPSEASKKDGDVRYLKRVYLVAGLVSAAVHISTVYTCVTSSDPKLSLSYVLLPDKSIWKDSMASGLHYIFQWDFWGAFAASLLWCWIVVYDVLRLLIGKPSAIQLVQMVLGIGFVALVAGPGTAMVMVWNWREDRLVMIENGVKGTWKKPKAA
ncbi:hypothetical protein GGR52DRAFT_535478 [Hypoxylon sp. FL1284]|nr:hypothetical protein GGR52DRAFT_535478 [Hypoxylon sp. FL1284]